MVFLSLPENHPILNGLVQRVPITFRLKAKTRDESLRLSAREEQILLLLAKGHSNKMIADNLEISVDTVCHHLKHVFEKMHVSSRTEAVVRYMASKTPAAS